MTDIFCLRDAEHFSDEKAVTDALKNVNDVSDLQMVPSFSELKKRLAEQNAVKPVVVIVSVPSHKLTPLLADLRTVSSTVSCVALLSENETSPVSPFDVDCQVLRRPFDSYALKACVAGAVRQSELLTALSSAVQLDEATGLFNQQYFMKRLTAEISLAKRHLSPLTCVIIGIRYYQVFLDSYGYEFTNRLIHHIGVSAHKQLRTEDIGARIGDQEIALLLPRSTEKGARVLTNRLLLGLNGTPFEFNGNRETIEVYAGIAGIPVEGHEKVDADTLVRFTHHALHSARFDDEEDENGNRPAGAVNIRLFSEIQPVL